VRDESYRVAIILAEDAVPRAERLAEECPVWVLRTPEAQAVAERARRKGADFTVFIAEADAKATLLGVLDEVELHHGPYSHDPPVSVIEVFGMQPTKVVREELHALGFGRVEASGDGFLAYRDSVPDLGRVAETWLAYQANLDELREREGQEAAFKVIREESDPRGWAAERVLAIGLSDSLEEQWELVSALCVAVTDATRRAILSIGAGPLEDMIKSFGDQALDLVQTEMANNGVLTQALRGVWVDEPLRTRIDNMLGEQPSA
jgi:hypothetical protein